MRYTNGIVIDLITYRKNCNNINNKINEFIQEIGLNIQKQKFEINHTKTKPTLFLGANLILPNKSLTTKQFNKKKNLHFLNSIALLKIRLKIPILKLIEQLEANGCVMRERKSTNKYRVWKQNKLVSVLN